MIPVADGLDPGAVGLNSLDLLTNQHPKRNMLCERFFTVAAIAPNLQLRLIISVTHRWSIGCYSGTTGRLGPKVNVFLTAQPGHSSSRTS